MLRLLLAQMASGNQVALVCPESPEAEADGIGPRAREAGIQPRMELSRGRGARPLRDVADARRLREILQAERPEILHVWHTRDHVLARRAIGARRGAGPRIVRSWSGSEPPSRWPWTWLLFSRWTDGTLCTSSESARLHGEFSGRPARAFLGAVEPDRFRPGSPSSELRRSLGVAGEGPVIGVIARVQPQRRFDLVLEALRRLADEHATVRLLVLGRGTHLERVARKPAERLGLLDRVIFAGYRAGDYVDAIRCMDLLTFLVPGSDGSCRALLEAQACGVPAVVSRRGALPEIVIDGETGLVVDEEVGALVDAWRSVLSRPGRRARMAAAAHARARSAFAPERLASEVNAFYRELL